MDQNLQWRAEGFNVEKKGKHYSNSQFRYKFWLLLCDVTHAASWKFEEDDKDNIYEVLQNPEAEFLWTSWHSVWSKFYGETVRYPVKCAQGMSKIKQNVVFNSQTLNYISISQFNIKIKLY